VSDLIQEFNHVLNSNLRVKVHSVALNMVDALYTQYPPAELGRVVGSDISGVVDKIGAGVTEWRVGDRVAGLLQGGTQNRIREFSFKLTFLASNFCDPPSWRIRRIRHLRAGAGDSCACWGYF